MFTIIVIHWSLQQLTECSVSDSLRQSKSNEYREIITMILVNKLWNNYWRTKAKSDDGVPTHGQCPPPPLVWNGNRGIRDWSLITGRGGGYKTGGGSM